MRWSFAVLKIFKPSSVQLVGFASSDLRLNLILMWESFSIKEIIRFEPKVLIVFDVVVIYNVDLVSSVVRMLVLLQHSN